MSDSTQADDILRAAVAKAEPGEHNPLDQGSSHYKEGDIEPIEYLFANGMGMDFCAGNVIKYLTRYRHSGKAASDLRKARHYIDFMLAQLDDGAGESAGEGEIDRGCREFRLGREEGRRERRIEIERGLKRASRYTVAG